MCGSPNSFENSGQGQTYIQSILQFYLFPLTISTLTLLFWWFGYSPQLRACEAYWINQSHRGLKSWDRLACGVQEEVLIAFIDFRFGRFTPNLKLCFN